MSVSLDLNFTTVENVLPRVKALEQEEQMISTEWLKRNCAEICNDVSWHNSF